MAVQPRDAGRLDVGDKGDAERDSFGVGRRDIADGLDAEVFSVPRSLQTPKSVLQLSALKGLELDFPSWAGDWGCVPLPARTAVGQRVCAATALKVLVPAVTPCARGLEFVFEVRPDEGI